MKHFLFIFFLTNTAISQTTEIEEVKIHINEPSHTAQINLAKLFIASFNCVDGVTDLQDGNILVRFNSDDCFIYEVVVRASRTEKSFAVVRDGWQENYMKNAEKLKLNFIVPPSLDGFIKLTDYQNWESETIQSELKKRERKVYRNFNFEGHIVRVSEIQLLESEKQHPQQQKEVEVAISFGDNYVFLVYNADGKLSSEAQFPNRKLKAPMSCNGCHYDAKTGTIARFFKKS